MYEKHPRKSTDWHAVSIWRHQTRSWPRSVGKIFALPSICRVPIDYPLRSAISRPSACVHLEPDMKWRFGSTGLLAASLLAGCCLGFTQAQAQDRASPLATGLGKDFASRSATVNGITLHYVRGGNGPALILIHGFPQDWYEYHAIMP